ncbi:MAG: MATE family efflux transporter [Sphaerochaetaceae bacterium]|nr:MATE family efflux transporter [Sphaerochaetaceae bacterium]
MDSLAKRQNLRTVITLAIPAIVEEVLSTLLQYVDTAMVGQLGEEATASVSLTNSVNWLIGSTFSAIGVAIVALMSTSYGAGEHDRVRKISSQVLLYSAVSGLVVGLLACGLSPKIPIWMQADVSIQGMAARYFKIISIPMIFKALTRICASALRAVKDTKSPMFINLAGNVLNVILNYLFIYTFGYGVIGAAIATMISCIFTGSLMLFVMLKHGMLCFSFNEMSLDKSILRQSFSIGFPAFATSFVSCMGHIVFASLVASMGTTVFAAHSIALSAESLFYLPGYGLRSATTTLIGISVGENDIEKFRCVKNQSVALTVAMMTFTGVCLFVCSPAIMGIFTPSLPVIQMGSGVLRLIAVSEPLYGIMIVSEGIYYGLGRTKRPFVVSTIGAWGIRIFFTVICVKLLKATLFEVWICMFADNSFRALALFIPLVSGKDKRFFEDRRSMIV